MCAGVYSRTGMRIEAASAAADKKGSRIQYRGKEGRKAGRKEGLLNPRDQDMDQGCVFVAHCS